MSDSAELEIEDGYFADPVLGKRYATPARVRARSLIVPKLETVEEREDYIEMLMVEQVWSPHTSRECQLVCGKAWGVAMTTVRDYSAAANRKMHARARDEGGMYASIALQSMSTVAQIGATSDLPGDKSAAVQASKELLKFAGLAEPEEDKQRGPTAFIIGTVITSPGMQALVGGAKRLNGHAANGVNGAIITSPAEGADGVPTPDRHS